MITRQSLDTLRGLACILLVSYHAGKAIVGMPSSHPMLWLNEQLSVLRMPLFAFLSGLVYAARPFSGNVARFLEGKARRLLVPMLIVGTACAVLEWRLQGARYDWLLLHVVPVAHYWFLESMFIVFALTALLERCGLLRGPQLLLVLVLAAIAYVALKLPATLGLQGAVFLLPFFLLGIACRRHTLPRAQLAPLLGALLLAMAIHFLPAPPDRHTLPALVMGACSCLLLLWAGRQSRALAWVGEQSFPIFLFHSMATGFGRVALKAAGVTDLTAVYAGSALVGLALPIVVALALRSVPHGRAVLGEKAQPAEFTKPAFAL